MKIRNTVICKLSGCGELNEPRNRTKVAVLYDRIGPYHHARLNALREKTELTVIEFSALDQTYAWEQIKDIKSYHRVTLFSDKPIEMHSSSVVFRRMTGVLDELQPQVVAFPGWDTPAVSVALMWCLKTGTPTVLMSDSQEHDQVRVRWKEWVKRRIVRLHCSGFAGGSPHVSYLKMLGMPVKRIFTGCDVVDNHFFKGNALIARQNDFLTRKKLSLPEQYFLASSRFIAKKNVFLLLRAYADYCTKMGDAAWKLVLLGDGPLIHQILELRRELGMDDKVILPGFRQYEELPAYYGLSGAFVHASTTEQWGLVVNEAMACGLPVIISSSCGCAPDLVRHGHNGFVFDPCDSHALSQFMEYVAEDELNRKAMGKASEEIISNWGLDRFVGSLCQAAEAALETPKPIIGKLDKALLLALIHRQCLSQRN